MKNPPPTNHPFCSKILKKHQLQSKQMNKQNRKREWQTEKWRKKQTKKNEIEDKIIFEKKRKKE